jgi:hypothetical protein
MGRPRANRGRQATLFPEEAPPSIEFPPETLRQAVRALAELLLGDLGADDIAGRGRARDDAEDQP